MGVCSQSPETELLCGNPLLSSCPEDFSWWQPERGTQGLFHCTGTHVLEGRVPFPSQVLQKGGPSAPACVSLQQGNLFHCSADGDVIAHLKEDH